MSLFPLDATCNAIPDQKLEPELESLREAIGAHTFETEIGTTEEVLEAFDASRARLNVVVGQILAIPGKIGLDIATGFGFLPVLLRRMDRRVIATELDKQLAEFALSQGIDVAEHTIGPHNYPVEPNSLDFAVLSEVIEHLKLAPVPVLEQIAGLLRPEGRLILTTPNIARLAHLEALVAGENFLEPFPSEAGMGDATGYVEHVREYSIREVVEALEAAAFTVESVLMTNFGRLGYEPLPNPFANEIIVATAQK